MPLFPSSRLHIRLLGILALVSTLIVFTVFWIQAPAHSSLSPHRILENIKKLGKGAKPEEKGGYIKDPPKAAWHHPIHDLILEAEREWTAVLQKRVQDVKSAATAYRRRRGRYPPPGYDEWVKYALSKDAVIVEDFFDQIYTDLEPFWGSPAKQLRDFARSFEFAVTVRGGEVSSRTKARGDGGDYPYVPLWEKMVGAVARHLPDVDMPINVLDETRVIAAQEDVDAHMAKARASRKVIGKSQVVSQFSRTSESDATTGVEVSSEEQRREVLDPEWTGGSSFFMLARNGCPPGSAFRDAEQVEDYSGPPPLPAEHPEGSYQGYVKNWTYVKDACHQPELREAHGTFIEPISISITKKLIPLFGGYKLSMNNEIIIPAPFYYSDKEMYTGGDGHGESWSSKKNELIWRGVGSGGRHHAETYTRFQRFRLVEMLNGTAVDNAVDSGSAVTFIPQPTTLYNLTSTDDQSPGQWLTSFADAGITFMECFPAQQDGTCPYTDHYFEKVGGIPMPEMYKYKYLPDIDGNSYSGRWWAFLLSTSLPMKATLYNEWHDSRLQPWLHFVPMHMSLVDMYGILDYFHGTGHNDGTGHDKAAERIATAGKEWAGQVLRKEDMEIYVYRLLLEFARLCDDQRELLGYADDIPDDQPA